MSKYLFICRHAETHPAAFGQSDFDRPLTAHGIQQARDAGAWIKDTGLTVPAIICSAALRTQTTARLIGETLHLPASAILPDAALYHVSASQLAARISLLPADQQVAVLVGHNPTVSDLVAKLNSRPGTYVPTGGVNLFTCNTEDWQEIEWCEVKWQANY